MGSQTVRPNLIRGTEHSRNHRDRLQYPRRDAPVQFNEIFANPSEYLGNPLSRANCEQMRAPIEACPACVAFMGDLRHASDRRKSLHLSCHADPAPKWRALLTKQYLRLVNLLASENNLHSL